MTKAKHFYIALSFLAVGYVMATVVVALNIMGA